MAFHRHQAQARYLPRSNPTNQPLSTNLPRPTQPSNSFTQGTDLTASSKKNSDKNVETRDKNGKKKELDPVEQIFGQFSHDISIISQPTQPIAATVPQAPSLGTIAHQTLQNRYSNSSPGALTWIANSITPFGHKRSLPSAGSVCMSPCPHVRLPCLSRPRQSAQPVLPPSTRSSQIQLQAAQGAAGQANSSRSSGAEFPGGIDNVAQLPHLPGNSYLLAPVVPGSNNPWNNAPQGTGVDFLSSPTASNNSHRTPTNRSPSASPNRVLSSPLSTHRSTESTTSENDTATSRKATESTRTTTAARTAPEAPCNSSQPPTSGRHNPLASAPINSIVAKSDNATVPTLVLRDPINQLMPTSHGCSTIQSTSTHILPPNHTSQTISTAREATNVNSTSMKTASFGTPSVGESFPQQPKNSHAISGTDAAPRAQPVNSLVPAVNQTARETPEKPQSKQIWKPEERSVQQLFDYDKSRAPDLPWSYKKGPNGIEITNEPAPPEKKKQRATIFKTIKKNRQKQLEEQVKQANLHQKAASNQIPRDGSLPDIYRNNHGLPGVTLPFGAHGLGLPLSGLPNSGLPNSGLSATGLPASDRRSFVGEQSSERPHRRLPTRGRDVANAAYRATTENERGRRQHQDEDEYPEEPLQQNDSYERIRRTAHWPSIAPDTFANADVISLNVPCDDRPVRKKPKTSHRTLSMSNDLAANPNTSIISHLCQEPVQSLRPARRDSEIQSPGPRAEDVIARVRRQGAAQPPLIPSLPSRAPTGSQIQTSTASHQGIRSHLSQALRRITGDHEDSFPPGAARLPSGPVPLHRFISLSSISVLARHRTEILVERLNIDGGYCGQTERFLVTGDPANPFAHIDRRLPFVRGIRHQDRWMEFRCNVCRRGYRCWVFVFF